MTQLIIKTGDATKLDIADNSVDLVIAQPPYLGVAFDRYGGNPDYQINSSNSKKMLKQLRKFTKEVDRVLKPNGHFVIANGPSDLVHYKYVIDLLDNTDFIHANTIIQNSYDENNMMYITSESILVNTVTIWHHFIKSYNAYANPYKLKKYNNPVWNIPFNNINDSVDQKLSEDYFVLDAMHKDIPTRFIEMLTKSGDVVLDPFGGTGMVAITAVELGRSGISIDISEDQTKIARERAKMVLGKLSILG